LIAVIAKLVILAVVSFFQNMAFTWTSRSRNSGDPSYHRFASWSSNGVWFITQCYLFQTAWKELMQGGNWWLAVLTGIVYSAATTEGSVLMMRLLLKHEKGSRKRGSATCRRRNISSS
jgi:hypothetical protein